MKRFLSVLLAVLIICMTVVPALAASSPLGALDLVGYAIEVFGESSARIHEAYADTLQKAMDYRKYYNEQGLAQAYDKMQVSMRNQGTSAYNTVLNTQSQTFYDMSRDYTYTYNTAYYNATYNSYYIPVTYNDVDYNYFVTYAPTYTNITYIVDGCNDPAQAVSNNYYFQLPDGRNSYDLTADEVFGIPLVCDVVNYDAVPENDSCLAMFHFDGNSYDFSGNGLSGSFSSGSVPQYTSVNGFGSCLTFTDEAYFIIPISTSGPYTVEFRINLGQYLNFNGRESFHLVQDSPTYFKAKGMTYGGKDCLFKTLYYKQYNHDSNVVDFINGGSSRFRLRYFTANLDCFDYDRNSLYYLSSGDYVRIDPDKAEGDFTAARAALDSVRKLRVEDLVFTFASSSNVGLLPQGQWLNCAYVYDGSSSSFYINGVKSSLLSRCFVSSGAIDSISLHGCSGFSYTQFDELRVSKGALYTANYTAPSAPFDVSVVLTLPAEKVNGNIAVKSAVPVAGVRLGGVRPSYPSEGDVYISLDSEKAVTSCQQYQSGSWVECDGAVCENEEWVNISGYSFVGQVVSEDDFADVVDKADDPEAGSAANPDSEITSFIVHYYKEGTEEKIRRDTVYQNLAVGASFTADAPTVAGYKALASSAEITVTADGEHIFYYSVDEADPGGGGGEEDKDSPGFFEKLFDGLLSGVKGLFNIIFGFVGGIVDSLLSGITGIISTLIDAFKAVLSLGGHFGDFLAAALGFIPREIIDLLIAGIAVSIVLAIVRFIRG